MTLLSGRSGVVEYPAHLAHGPSCILKWITSTDHKVIGKSYLITSFFSSCMADVMAMIMRTQLASPDNTVVSQHLYNKLLTMHGSLMLYLVAGPFAFGGLVDDPGHDEVATQSPPDV